MAEPTKPKRPSRSKKAPQPDFSPFKDWLIDGPAGKWPSFLRLEGPLSDRQKEIVAANAALLLDSDAWHMEVEAFETALADFRNESDRKKTRAKYAIRLDGHSFPDGPKNFSDYPFPCSVSFNGVVFGNGVVSFNGANFCDGDVSFDDATFGDGDVSFVGGSFGDGEISFVETTFYGSNFYFLDVSLQSTSMCASGMVVDGNLFVQARFPERTMFFRLDVKGTANFSRSSFDKVPDFRGAKFDRPPEVAAMQVPRPRLSRPKAWIAAGWFIRRYRGIEDDVETENDNQRKERKTEQYSTGEETGNADMSSSQPSWLSRAVVAATGRVHRVSTSIFRLATDTEDVAKFRKLKSMALAANDHEKDGEFFAGEMLAKRGFETTTFFGLLFNTIYWWLSDFGQSFVRPLLWLGVSFFSFAGLCLYLIRDALTLTDRLWFAVDFSFRNMLPLFGSLFRFASAPKDHVSWYQKTYDRLATAGVDIDLLIGLGIAQSLFGTVLLFLLLLALRNKFRLK